MEIYRRTRSHNMGVNPGNSVEAYNGSTGGAQGLATLVTMIAVLVIILLFCFWSAPGIRDFCRRNICCYCPMDDPAPRELTEEERTNHGVPLHNNDHSATMPTIVLLPFGRMLVVDRSIFTQMEADDTGLDFLELSANVIRAHHNYLMQNDPEYMLQHQESLGRSDDSLSKGGDLTLSQLSIEHKPPPYEEIFGSGKSSGALPPSYSEANLLLRQLVRTASLNILQQVYNTQSGQRPNTRSFSTRTVNDSALIHYESERRLPPPSNRRFFRQVNQRAPHQARSISLDEAVLPELERRVGSLSSNRLYNAYFNLPQQQSSNLNIEDLAPIEASVNNHQQDQVVVVIGSSEENNNTNVATATK